jgi:hypothetical protein
MFARRVSASLTAESNPATQACSPSPHMRASRR